MASRRIRRGPFGQKNATILSALYHLNVGERTALLKNANPRLVNQICECALNLLEGNIPLSGGQKKRLRKHARVLRKLAGPTTAKRKKSDIGAERRKFITSSLSTITQHFNHFLDRQRITSLVQQWSMRKN